ncbi:hypothetical protein ED733_000747 [Metarhizium rileyi]|uniref:Tat pathway signal sequence n=1 Tax=Metarhizium rileyi (strain RCEF 4871) TaxID=1649241 RepID=A0A5C6FZS1_METRR|nr:hypothetical protein ED733_000747 [Metarhizium rileyi]
MNSLFRAWREYVRGRRRKESYDDDANNTLLDQRLRNPDKPTFSWTQIAPWILFHGAIAATYIVLIPYILPVSYTLRRQSCVTKFNYYSPINEAIQEDYSYVRFNGSLWYDSPYKGPPTPKVEQAWQDLMAYGTISVTADDITRIGHNLTAVQFPEAAGGGYLAVAMGTHQIHCLHFVWQDHHIASFPKAKASKEGASEMYERHYEHCIDYIRQTLMCNFDPGIIPYYWVRKHSQPTPDGNTRHKCVNWHALQDWLRHRAVKIPDGFEWHQPPDAVPLADNP